MDVYVVTGTGPLIDTICEVFKTEEEANSFLEKEWEELGEHSSEEIAGCIWKTEDEYNQNIEWEIHKKTIDKSNRF